MSSTNWQSILDAWLQANIRVSSRASTPASPREYLCDRHVTPVSKREPPVGRMRVLRAPTRRGRPPWALGGSVLTFWLCCLRRSAPRSRGCGSDDSVAEITGNGRRHAETPQAGAHMSRRLWWRTQNKYSLCTTTSSNRQRLGRRCRSIGITGLPV